MFITCEDNPDAKGLSKNRGLLRKLTADTQSALSSAVTHLKTKVLFLVGNSISNGNPSSSDLLKMALTLAFSKG